MKFPRLEYINRKTYTPILQFPSFLYTPVFLLRFSQKVLRVLVAVFTRSQLNCQHKSRSSRSQWAFWLIWEMYGSCLEWSSWLAVLWLRLWWFDGLSLSNLRLVLHGRRWLRLRMRFGSFERWWLRCLFRWIEASSWSFLRWILESNCCRFLWLFWRRQVMREYVKKQLEKL